VITRLAGLPTALCMALVRAVIGLLAASIGLASIASAEATPAAPHVTYAYDSQHHNSVPTEATNERGPPGRDAADNTVLAAVDARPRGASVRPDVTTLCVSFAYDHLALLVQVARVAPRRSCELRPKPGRRVLPGARALPQTALGRSCEHVYAGGDTERACFISDR